jgi:hypothetical protein
MTEPSFLASADIHVWAVDIGDPAWDALALHGPHEGLSWGSRRTWAAALPLLASHAGLREEELRIVRDERGKPHLADGSLAFNLSHSGSEALIAISRLPVGVDLEQALLPEGELVNLYDIVLSPREIALLLTCHPSKRRISFYRSWVRKEAYLKFAGLGLSRAMTDIRIEEAVSGSPVHDRCATGPSPFLYDLDVGTPTPAAICSPIERARIRLTRLRTVDMARERCDA